MDTEQMFRLIDSILPFEGCLYYQILPLSLEGSTLNLGMVNPKDSSALDYARRILAYLNCSLKPQPIAAETHQSMLSAYLNHTSKLKTASGKTPENNSSVSPTDRPTLIVDSPAQLDLRQEENQNLQPVNGEEADSQPETSSKSLESGVPEQNASLTIERSSASQNTSSNTPKSPVLPVLEVQILNLSRPLELLAMLPPQQLLQELLGRVIAGGIGRLYFERQQQNGRILWSQDGILQSVLEGLSLPLFQSVINELKRMANLPLIPLEKPKQVEIERRYQQNRLLLCLRVMPGQLGEEATLQVLRGAALKFYQQQQVARLSRDALSLAQQLQRKLNEIRDRTRLNPTSLDVLPALDQMLESLHQQVEAIRQEATDD